MNNDPVAQRWGVIAPVRIEKGSVIPSKRRDLLRHRGNIVFAERPANGMVQGIMRDVVEKKMPYGPPHYFALLEFSDGTVVELPIFGSTFYGASAPGDPKSGGRRRSSGGRRRSSRSRRRVTRRLRSRH